MVQKLHILSKIGLFLVKALSEQLELSLDAPRLVLLPSSHYKVCQDARNREVSSQNLHSGLNFFHLELHLDLILSNLCNNNYHVGISYQ